MAKAKFVKLQKRGDSLVGFFVDEETMTPLIKNQDKPFMLVKPSKLADPKNHIDLVLDPAAKEVAINKLTKEQQVKARTILAGRPAPAVEATGIREARPVRPATEQVGLPGQLARKREKVEAAKKSLEAAVPFSTKGMSDNDILRVAEEREPATGSELIEKENAENNELVRIEIEERGNKYKQIERSLTQLESPAEHRDLFKSIKGKLEEQLPSSIKGSGNPGYHVAIIKSSDYQRRRKQLDAMIEKLERVLESEASKPTKEPKERKEPEHEEGTGFKDPSPPFEPAPGFLPTVNSVEIYEDTVKDYGTIYKKDMAAYKEKLAKWNERYKMYKDVAGKNPTESEKQSLRDFEKKKPNMPVKYAFYLVDVRGKETSVEGLSKPDLNSQIATFAYGINVYTAEKIPGGGVGLKHFEQITFSGPMSETEKAALKPLKKPRGVGGKSFEKKYPYEPIPEDVRLQPLVSGGFTKESPASIIKGRVSVGKLKDIAAIADHFTKKKTVTRKKKSGEFVKKIVYSDDESWFRWQRETMNVQYFNPSRMLLIEARLGVAKKDTNPAFDVAAEYGAIISGRGLNRLLSRLPKGEIAFAWFRHKTWESTSSTVTYGRPESMEVTVRRERGGVVKSVELPLGDDTKFVMEKRDLSGMKEALKEHETASSYIDPAIILDSIKKVTVEQKKPGGNDAKPAKKKTSYVTVSVNDGWIRIKNLHEPKRVAEIRANSGKGNCEETIYNTKLLALVFSPVNWTNECEIVMSKERPIWVRYVSKERSSASDDRTPLDHMSIYLSPSNDMIPKGDNERPRKNRSEGTIYQFVGGSGPSGKYVETKTGDLVRPAGGKAKPAVTLKGSAGERMLARKGLKHDPRTGEIKKVKAGSASGQREVVKGQVVELPRAWDRAWRDQYKAAYGPDKSAWPAIPDMPVDWQDLVDPTLEIDENLANIMNVMKGNQAKKRAPVNFPSNDWGGREDIMEWLIDGLTKEARKAEHEARKGNLFLYTKDKKMSSTFKRYKKLLRERKNIDTGNKYYYDEKLFRKTVYNHAVTNATQGIEPKKHILEMYVKIIGDKDPELKALLKGIQVNPNVRYGKNKKRA